MVFDGNVADQLEFMDRYGFRAAKTSLYKAVGDFEAAGEVHQQAGEIEQAVRCFLSSEHQHVRRRAIPGVLDSLRDVAFGSKLTSQSTQLLRLLDSVAEEDFTREEEIQVRYHLTT